jgi:hypothetical protein
MCIVGGVDKAKGSAWSAAWMLDPTVSSANFQRKFLKIRHVGAFGPKKEERTSARLCCNIREGTMCWCVGNGTFSSWRNVSTLEYDNEADTRED